MKIKTPHAQVILACLLALAASWTQAVAQSTPDKKSVAGTDAQGQDDKEAGDAQLPWGKETGLKQHMMLTRIKGSRKIDIRPAKPTDGISTGLIIAYGHVIAPPYKIEYRDRKLYVNGVQVRPSLILEREPRNFLPLLTRTQARATFKATQIQRAAQALYVSGLKTKPLKEVQAEIVALVMKSTDVFVSAEWLNSEVLNAKEVDSGAVHELRFSATLPAELTPKESRRQEEEGERRARDRIISSIKKQLEMGYCVVFLSDGGRIGKRDSREKIGQIMQEPGLTREQRIEKLRQEAFAGNYEPALDVVDNYEEEEWRVR